MKGLLPIGLCLCLVGPSLAQVQEKSATALGLTEALVAAEKPTTVESPLWWPLTDELSPQELKNRYEDPTQHIVRFHQAVELGYTAPKPEEQLVFLTSYFNGRATPELIPMWIAFDAFSSKFYFDRDLALQEVPFELYEYGLEPEPAHTIIRLAIEHLDASQALAKAITPAVLEFVNVMDEASSMLEKSAFDKAVDMRDSRALARATARDSQEVHRLMQTWSIEPSKFYAMKNLPKLEAELSSEDWERFRLFLLEEQATQMSTIDFEYPGE